MLLRIYRKFIQYLACGRRPRGTGFLKFKTVDAAAAAVSAANAASGLGIFLKGRSLKIMKALDKKSAHDIELKKAQSEDHDHRNLYLAKVDFLNTSPSSVFSFCEISGSFLYLFCDCLYISSVVDIFSTISLTGRSHC